MAKHNSSRAFRDRRKAVLRGSQVCWLCQQPIDSSLKWPDPMSGSADHILPVSRGGTDSISNLRPSHLGCNIKRQNKDANEVAPQKNSRDW